jgi:hypothetical protein
MIGRGRIAGRALVAVAAIGLVLAAASDADARDNRSGGWRRSGGGWHGGARPVFHHHPHFHSFVFVGAGFGYPGYYYAGYPPYYAPPAYLPPPVYVSKDDCYNTVPRGPGVADLYTCGGQYVGPISVP